MNYTLSATILALGLFIGAKLYAQTEEQGFFEGTLQFSVEFKGEQADLLKQNEPNDEIIMHIKEGDYIVQLRGGRYPKTFIFMADSNHEYSVNFKEKLAFKYSKYTDRTLVDKNKEKPSAKPTGKQKEINGILCEEYRMATPKTVFYYYVNDAYVVDLAKYPDRPRTKASWLAEGLEGKIPLQTVKKQKDLVVKTTVKSVKTKDFDPRQFQIPKGFKVKGRDYRY
ncbi:MAG: hypothetical protein MRZ79_24955 [Bacteroidia bacterium]|nr:hypothetical protein [Bacteroidia bacterium]